ncbi:MAG: putative transporter substrate binding protein precursor [Chloroflexi bacterium]|nr:putative transporter substrate binding protein precursor [Chloroflexota bacterium]
MNSRKMFIWLAIFLVLATLITGCAPAATPTVVSTPTVGSLTLTDGLGRNVIFDQPAQRIVSIAPSNTEVLFAIGAGAQVIGRDEFSDYPDQAKQLPSVGGGYGALDMETMVSLKPDLVLASQLTPAEQVQAIEKLGLKVFLLPNPNTIEDMFANLLEVGKITGTEAQAQTLIDGLKTRVAAVDAKVAAVQQKPVVFYELDSTDPNAPWTAGPGSFIDALISRAGGVNLGAKLKDSYAQISIEQLLVDQPDIIIAGDYTWGGVTAEAIKARQSWADLQAVKQDKVYIFDDNLVSRPGPRLVDGLEAMEKLLHP